MTIMQKVLSVMVIGERVQQRTVLERVEQMSDRPLTYSQKSSLRSSIFKLGETGMVEKQIIYGVYYYTLLKDKKFYVPLKKTYQLAQTDGKPRPIVSKCPIDWFASQKVHSIEKLAKELNTPMPKTKQQIVEFYKKATK